MGKKDKIEKKRKKYTSIVYNQHKDAIAEFLKEWNDEICQYGCDCSGNYNCWP